MTLEEVIGYFKEWSVVYKKLNIKCQNITKWKRQNYIPWAQQYRISELTNWELKPDKMDPGLKSRMTKMEQKKNKKRKKTNAVAKQCTSPKL